ncbi:UDP-N-acetylmuramate--L-alanine ligase [Oleidesulfovibrio alaskensis G20]|uniref:UDP-N-acetylmuramate--L-alanine ligase n=2 Tax=Oleidesulfovibrio alaskensis TaxID=58180 RepID=MURC_OLEA2|nr:RecName: Full=UDP-N-acetylmuramate--L-alanine ligase; AltName: Full=UDP-N-acetylmuramoyl-L-alanine synthetase [Oleidesulfovibrio alaskensis G20]ABB37844.1 UDP-N-acetylmuramate--L-alanine ligase [Oleidesulfovibrio alaskensis G20]MBG0773697.1 UDP-N-acetylmuramate--L-alanine ligase [Oleidesulfovibrio alaskensis]
MIGKVFRIHMVGIGGTGMCGIAEVLLNLGFEVRGSDMNDSPSVRRLRRLGADIFIGHGAENVTDAQVLVKSTAVSMDNPEVQAAQEKGIPIIPRAEMLAELMRLRKGIAIAGTHGKTTTTSLTAAIFDEAGTDPTVIIGGRLNAYGSNARLGEGEFLLAEADESDGSFLCLSPVVNVVTNVDLDHVDFYHDQQAIDTAFINFMNKVPFYGMNVVCGDDAGVRRLLPQIKRPVLTYGFGPDNQLRAETVTCGETSRFRVLLHGEDLGEVNLVQPGRHNVLNALAAIGVGLETGIAADVCLRGLANFRGVGRRFERKGERGGVLVVDDYGHHPAEIAATLATARTCYPGRRLVVAFQPHRFSRTKALFGDFCKAFDNVDKLLLTEIYPASEAPIPGVSGQSLAQGIRQVSNTDVDYFQDFDAMRAALPETLRPGDLFLTLGAGSIWTVGQFYLDGE